MANNSSWVAKTDEEDEVEDSFIINSDGDDGNEIETSENNETKESFSHLIEEDDNNDSGRLTPIHRYIRHSIHKFQVDDSREHIDTGSEYDDEDDAGHVIIPESSEESDSEILAIKRKSTKKKVLRLSSSDEDHNYDATTSSKEEDAYALDDSSRTHDMQKQERKRLTSKNMINPSINDSSYEQDSQISQETSPVTKMRSINISSSSDEQEATNHDHHFKNNLDKQKDNIRIYETEERTESPSYPEFHYQKDQNVRNSLVEIKDSDSDASYGYGSKNKDSETSSIMELDHSENKENISSNSQSELAISIALEESRNSSLDPILAQKQAYLEHEKNLVEKKLSKIKLLFNSGTADLLPDRGEKLRLSILKEEKQLEKINKQIRELHSESILSSSIRDEKPKKYLEKNDIPKTNPFYEKPTNTIINKELGKKAAETLEREQTLTVERLKDLHGSLISKPEEHELAQDPSGLKVTLMPHQKYALTWLLWREKGKPAGGVLADDMGLGKTLTMISLIVATNNTKDGDDEEDEWLSSKRDQRFLGGTLVVAPASLLGQWESEIKNRCKRSLLSVELYHGNNREINAKRLSRNDVVITTYNIVSRSFKSTGILHKIHWKRIILDEAHIIRNHKSQTCEGVCGLSGMKKWVLTGTPVQNKEMDLFSLLKFLKCSPFDDLRVWKRWVDNKNAAGHERLATVMKTIMLRRTKSELQAAGGLQSLPEKKIETIEVQLDPEERLVYDKVMVYSRTLFAQFLAQRAEKAHSVELASGYYDKPCWMVNYRDTQFTKAQKKLLSAHADVAAHEILVLLLRLRQVCCQPSLIHAMLDQNDIDQNALEDMDEPGKLMDKMNNLSICEDDDDGEIGVDKRVTEHLLTSENPVFDDSRRSSKLRAIIANIKEIVSNKDKLIVVSQWVGFLEILGKELESNEGISCSMFTGKTAVKDRSKVVDDFNSPHSKVNVLLLSLTAGGVGLNLVGANHLLLIDIHWNPQLECQAQDRIYRFGQKKPVSVYKYICVDTIEERIKQLQERKMELATNLLSGGTQVANSKLTLDEMKSLFDL